MGVSVFTSYYRWNAVCGENRTCGVDLNEIPRRIVRDDEVELNEWMISNNSFNGFTDLNDSILITEAVEMSQPIYRLKDSGTINYYNQPFKEIEFGGSEYYIYLHSGSFTDYLFYGPYDGILASVVNEDTIEFSINVDVAYHGGANNPTMVTTSPLVVAIEEIGNSMNTFYCGLQIDTDSDTPVVVVPVS